MHEDGGAGATFVETNPRVAELTRVARGVVVGSTFRVVACDCARRADDYIDFCEFCRCRCTTCGGESVPRRFRNYAGGSSGGGMGSRGYGCVFCSWHGGSRVSARGSGLTICMYLPASTGRRRRFVGSRRTV